jgi:surface protein
MSDPNNNINREEQFQLTPAAIEVRRNELQQVPFDELAEMFRIQEGTDPGELQTVAGRVSRADKKKLIDCIIEYMVKNHNPVTEERYQFVEWLYWIRKQHGNRYGFLQPDFICIIFGKLMTSKLQRSDADIQIAVNEWCEDPAAAAVMYGHISKWNTSLVTNMTKLFNDKNDFIDDISKWNVSNVTDMNSIFWNTSFNGDISGWNVSSVTNMSSMFSYARYFDGDISGWNVRNVTNMNSMFLCTLFGGDISGWDVSSVTNMDSMFMNSPFNGDISMWNVSSVTNMSFMFIQTPFNGDISGWDVSSVTDMGAMFFNTPFNGDISGWDVSSVTIMGSMFTNCPITEEHKPTFNGSLV